MTRVQQLQCIIAWGSCACMAGPAVAISVGTTSQGLPYVTGGITDDERSELDANAVPHGLKVVTVARESGDYLADARVVIADADGRKLLDAQLDGPFLQLELDPGRYVVDAQFERQVVSKEIVVGSQAPRVLVFAFDADADPVPGAQIQ